MGWTLSGEKSGPKTGILSCIAQKNADETPPSDNGLMPTITLVTSVFLSKAEALDLLARTLEVEWIVDDPSDVTLPLPDGGVLSIEIPKFGEDLPLTLDVHHPDQSVLSALAEELAGTLSERLAWQIEIIR